MDEAVVGDEVSLGAFCNESFLQITLETSVPNFSVYGDAYVPLFKICFLGCFCKAQQGAR